MEAGVPCKSVPVLGPLILGTPIYHVPYTIFFIYTIVVVTLGAAPLVCFSFLEGSIGPSKGNLKEHTVALLGL